MIIQNNANLDPFGGMYVLNWHGNEGTCYDLLTTIGSVDAAGENLEDPSDVDETLGLIWLFQPEQVDRGAYQVQVRWIRRDPRMKPPLAIQNVEVQINLQSSCLMIDQRELSATLRRRAKRC